mgnify:CR=1 FL=1
MKLSVTSWSFPQCNLSESTGLSNLLGINAIDLGYFYRSALDKNALLEDYKKIITEINKYNQYKLLYPKLLYSLPLIKLQIIRFQEYFQFRISYQHKKK